MTTISTSSPNYLRSHIEGQTYAEGKEPNGPRISDIVVVNHTLVDAGVAFLHACGNPLEAENQGIELSL